MRNKKGTDSDYGGSSGYVHFGTRPNKGLTQHKAIFLANMSHGKNDWQGKDQGQLGRMGSLLSDQGPEPRMGGVEEHLGSHLLLL